MISKFLKAKHWQLFLIMLGIPLVFQIIAILLMIFSDKSDGGFASSFESYYFTIVPIILMLSFVIFFGWFWSIAVGLNSQTPKEIRPKLIKFKVAFFIPTIYILFLLLLMAFVFGRQELNPILLLIIIPLHLGSMFCLFYILYFVSKTIKIVERQQDVRFSAFAGEFFLLWFYFIGIWIIQPKINRLYESEGEKD